MRFSKILFIAALISISCFAQEKSLWFPAKLNIQPFTANFLEPNTGFAYMLGKNKIRLDVGTSQDFYQYKNNKSTFSVGADFFTYTRLHGTSEFHFPVEAVDYFFGMNAAYKIKKKKYEYGARLRISHISAHFVDGRFDYSTNYWVDGRHPRVYSREFIEFLPFYKTKGLRFYGGFTYLFHTTPRTIGKGIFQTGFDYYFYPMLKNFVTPFVAYDFKLSQIGKYAGNNIISAGLKIGKVNGRGISILYTYHSGKSIHGEFYDLNENYSTVGFNIDL